MAVSRWLLFIKFSYHIQRYHSLQPSQYSPNFLCGFLFLTAVMCSLAKHTRAQSRRISSPAKQINPSSVFMRVSNLLSVREVLIPNGILQQPVLLRQRKTQTKGISTTQYLYDIKSTSMHEVNPPGKKSAIFTNTTIITTAAKISPRVKYYSASSASFQTDARASCATAAPTTLAAVG